MTPFASVQRTIEFETATTGSWGWTPQRGKVVLGELLRERERGRGHRAEWSGQTFAQSSHPNLRGLVPLAPPAAGTGALYLLFPLLHAFLFSSCITFSGHFLSIEEIGLTFPKTTWSCTCLLLYLSLSSFVKLSYMVYFLQVLYDD